MLYQLSYVPLLTCKNSVAEVHVVADILEGPASRDGRAASAEATIVGKRRRGQADARSTSPAVTLPSGNPRSGSRPMQALGAARGRRGVTTWVKSTGSFLTLCGHTAR